MSKNTISEQRQMDFVLKFNYIREAGTPTEEKADVYKRQNWNRMFTAAIYRMPGIKWAADGKFYSASTALAGLEMCLDIIADLVDFDEAMRISEKFGYTWNPEEEEGIYR